MSGRAMAGWTAALLALGAASASALPPEGTPGLEDLRGPRPSGGQEAILVRKVSDALDRWDLPAAQQGAIALEEKHPDGAASIQARAVVRFYEGRYGEAVALLDRLGGKQELERNGMVQLIRKTARITGKFAEKKGTHFVVKYQPGPDEILAEWTLETLEAQRAALEADLGYAPPEIVPVEIYPTGDEFGAVTTLTRKEIETSGTIALCKFNRLMITTPGALAFGYGWRDTLAHEYTHYVVARMTGNKVPIWLHEGIAKHQEVRWRLPVGGEINPTVETVLAEGLAKDYFIPFERMHPSIAKLPSAFDATLAFAEVESLIGYTLETWDHEGLRALLHGLRDGKPMDVALIGAFGVGLKGLEEKWRVHLAENPPRLDPNLEMMPTTLKDPKADAEESGAAHRGLSEEAARRLRLGDLLAGEVRAEAAVVEYRQARDAEMKAKAKHGPIFDYKIASLYVATNRWPEAKKALEPLLESYPTYAPALKAMGKTELAEGDPGKARSFLERSLWQAPFDAEAHHLLSESCRKANDTACAEKASARMKRLLKLTRR